MSGHLSLEGVVHDPAEGLEHQQTVFERLDGRHAYLCLDSDV
jgi:hypothetical protein